MIRRILPLAIAAAAPLLAMSSGAHAQPANEQPANEQPASEQPASEQQATGQPQMQQAPGQQAQPGQEGAQASATTSTCRFTNGPRKGSVVDFSATPGVAAVPAGSRCQDMTGSSGVAISSESSRAPGQGRFYRTPEAPVGLDRSGQPAQGYTLSCRFSSGPNAGNTRDFSGVLGATPIRIGSTCSDGGNKGVGVAAGGAQGQQMQPGQPGQQGPGGQ